MKRNRFAEAQNFADRILKSWTDYVNNRGFEPLTLTSDQMTEHDLAISVRLAPGFKDRMSLSLYDSKHHWELFSASPVDNTKKTFEYTIDFLLTYCTDVIGIGLKEE